MVDPYNQVRENNEGNNVFMINAHVENCEGKGICVFSMDKRKVLALYMSSFQKKMVSEFGDI